MYSFVGTVNEVYPTLVQHIRDQGRMVRVRGTRTREISPVSITLVRPWQRLVTSYGRPMNVAFAMAEVVWMLQGRRDVEFLAWFNESIRKFSDDGLVFEAPYGYRLRRAHGYDQLEDAVLTLQEDPSSRQATLVTWHPNDRGHYFDPHGMMHPIPHRTKDRACNVLSHLMIRDGKLDWLQVVRSNDVILGVPYNFFQWTCMQEYMARRLDVEMGQFTYIADSMHMYQDTYYGEQPEIRPFNLYEHVLGNPTIDTDPVELDAIENLVERVQHGDLRSNADRPRPTSDIFRTFAKLTIAHQLYREGMNRACLVTLMEAGLYGVAQIRFYWHMRWEKLPTSERQELVRLFIDRTGYTPGADEMPHWIFPSA